MMFDTKKKLAIAVAGISMVCSAASVAQRDLNATTGATSMANVFASEFDASTGTPLSVTNVGGVEFNSPIDVAVSTNRYYRIDLSSGTFVADPVVTFTGPANAPTVTGNSLGGAGESFFAVEFATAGAAGDEIDSGDNINFAGNVNVTSTADAVTVTLGIYEDASEAQDATSPLGGASSGTYFSFATGLDVDFVTTNDVAEVQQNFLQYDGGVAGTFGSVALGFQNLAPNDGMAVTAADLFTAVQVDVVGDFTPTDDASGDIQTASTVLGALTQTTADATDTLARFTNAGGFLASALTVTAAGNTAIQPATYTATLSFTEVANVTIADVVGTLGSTTRNGTNVDIPYITTFSDYNQRIILVNRGTSDAIYTITFTPESGVTATGASAATGTVPAGETLIVRTTDVVTITGGTRTAGFISIVAPTGVVDVATTQVNLSDASTDTVVLQ